MASLVIHSEEPIQAATFSHRVLIGRKPFNGVQLGQRVVSRIHAWIDREGDSFYIRDARSRGGTFVNSTRTDGKVMLHDGDVIKVGVSKMTFHDSDELPDGAIVFNIAEKGTNPDFADPGILIACEACGAPMWVPATMAGAFGRCAICAGAIMVPGDPASGIRRPLTPNDSIVDMPAITQPVELGDAARPIDPLAADFPQPQPSRGCRAIAASAKVPSFPAMPPISAPVAPRLITPNVGMKTTDAPPMAARRSDRSILCRQPWRLAIPPILPTPPWPPGRKCPLRSSGNPRLSRGILPCLAGASWVRLSAHSPSDCRLWSSASHPQSTPCDSAKAGMVWPRFRP